MKAKEHLLVFLACICVRCALSGPVSNDTARMISKYAKVTRYGQPNSNSKGRSGQTPWTHRSDVQIVTSQSLGKDLSPTKEPGIQDRFNPKPYFYYNPVSGSKALPTPNGNGPVYTPPSPVYSPPQKPPQSSIISLPALQSEPPKSNEDSYASPYTSYNPPPSKDNSLDSYAPPKDSNYGGFGEPPKPSDAPSEDDQHAVPPPDEDEEHGFVDAAPSKHQTLGPPLAPHMIEDDDIRQIYPQPPPHKEVILDHPPPGYQDHGESAMMPPLPPQDHDFPGYLYDDHHDHQVYHEVEHKEPEPEKQRVSGGHYSYAYLGRKLWYIPLYFSVYFILYVTFLIIKSIARHKVHLKHDLHDHFHGRNSRSLYDKEHIDDIHKNVTTAIKNVQTKYAM